MQKVLLILGLALLLAVVEQTSGQICSENYCRYWKTRSNCKCRGCCLGKLGYHYGGCEPHFGHPGGPQIYSCFCYQFNPQQQASIRGPSGDTSNTTTIKPPT